MKKLILALLVTAIIGLGQTITHLDATPVTGTPVANGPGIINTNFDNVAAALALKASTSATWPWSQITVSGAQVLSTIGAGAITNSYLTNPSLTVNGITCTLGGACTVSGSSGGVPSVFGRSGAVVAGTGDYTAAQVTNAVDSTQTYVNPSWLTQLAWAKLTGVPSFESPLTFSGPLVRSVNAISIPAATGSVPGYLTAADWTTFNAKQAALGFTPQNAASANGNNELPLMFNGPLSRTLNAISITAAASGVPGYLTAADWAAFTAKQTATLSAILSTIGAAGIPNSALANPSVTVNGTTCTLGSTCSPAGGSGITALTGDVTATGPGSVAGTLATVNGAPGACGDATHVCAVTTNGKGLTTAQTATTIAIAESQVTNLVSDLAAKGTGNPGGYTTVTFSATPTFTAASNTASAFLITLTGNVTSSTLAGAATGQIITFKICQDATGSRTFAFPTNVTGAGVVDGTASGCNNQSFVFDGANAVPIAPAYVTGLTGGAWTAPGSTSGSTKLIPSAIASGVLTLPPATDTLVGRNTTDTLTNKSIAASQVNSGTLPTAQMPGLTGDATSTAGTVAVTVVKVNGAVVPTSATVVGTNASQQIVARTPVGNSLTPQMAGTVAGTGAALCTDANLNTTTTGCPTATVDATAVKNALSCVDSGAVNAAICTTTTAFPAYASGQTIRIQMVATNTSTTPTVNVGGQGVKTITKNNGTALAASDLLIGLWYFLTYNGTTFDFTQGAAGGGSPGGSPNSLQYQVSAGVFGGTVIPTATDPQAIMQTGNNPPASSRVWSLTGPALNNARMIPLAPVISAAGTEMLFQTADNPGSVVLAPSATYIVPSAGGIRPELTISNAGTGGTGTGLSLIFSGGGCSVQPVGTYDVTAGALSAYRLTSLGSGCTSAPTVAATNGSLSGATITATFNAVDRAFLAMVSTALGGGGLCSLKQNISGTLSLLTLANASASGATNNFGYVFPAGSQINANCVNASITVFVTGEEFDASSALFSKILVGGSATTQTLYTVPTGAHTSPTNPAGFTGSTKFVVANSSGGTVVFAAYAVPSGGTAAAGNQTASGVSVATGAAGNLFSVATLGGGGTFQINFGSAGTATTLSVWGTFATDTGSH